MPNAPRQFKAAGTAKPKKPWQHKGPDLRKGMRGRKAVETKKRILERDGYQCQNPNCGRLVEGMKDSILDHIKPLSQGGSHDDENLQTLCIKCSKAKTQAESNGKRWSKIDQGGVG